MQLRALYKPESIRLAGTSFERLPLIDKLTAELPLSKCSWIGNCKAASLETVGLVLANEIHYGGIIHVNWEFDVHILIQSLKWMASDNIYYLGSISDPLGFACSIQTYYEIGCFYDYCLDLQRYSSFLQEQGKTFTSKSLYHYESSVDMELTNISMELYAQRFKHKWINVA